jgi:alcohol dehydrogenase class IV
MSLVTYLTTIRFEFDALAGSDDDLREVRVAKRLIVAKVGLGRAGLIDRLRDVVPSGAGVPVFAETPTNPTERDRSCRRGSGRYRRNAPRRGGSSTGIVGERHSHGSR